MKKTIFAICTILALSGCTALYTRMSKSDMEIKTAMSSTIWLEPTNPATTKIYVQTRNTSDNSGFDDMARPIKNSLMAKGYIIADNPDEARFGLQVNVLKAVLINDRASAEQASSSGLLAGVGTGMAVGAGTGKGGAAVGAGLLAGLGSMMFDANTKDGYYAVQADVRITEKSRTSYDVNTFQVSTQGDALTASGTRDRTDTKSYTTRVGVLANKVNLTAEEALLPVREALVKSLAGLF